MIRHLINIVFFSVDKDSNSDNNTNNNRLMVE